MYAQNNPFIRNSAFAFFISPPDFSSWFPTSDGNSNSLTFSRNSHHLIQGSEDNSDDEQMSSSAGNIFMRGLSRISRRKKKTKALVENQQVSTQPSFLDSQSATPSVQYQRSTILSKGMDRLRRSLRLPRRRDRSNDRHLSPQTTGGSKQDQWQPDESAVRTGNCCFNVKYLGSVEVFESRGMQVCEGALKSLKASRRKPVKAVLYVSGDGLRVVDQGNSRGLLVDQTIEKVSFCAPDRMNDKGFAYICRDGTSRRWMCHGFHATKESGERLSHAVGCAFAICLERKKKRDEENAATINTIPSTSTKSDALNPNWDDTKSEPSMNQRSNLAYQSFRKHVSIAERYMDPQSVIINEVPAVSRSDEIKRISKPRPASNPALFQRQGSLRAPDQPNLDQFKRNLSLRTNPSFEASPKKNFGTTLFNEPIYEGDEDPLGLGLNPSKSDAKSTNPVSKNGLDEIDLYWSGNQAPFPYPTSLLTSTNGDFANWPYSPSQQTSNVSSPLDDIQKQFEEIKINTKTSNGQTTSVPSFMSTSTSKSKADEWLDDVLRVSMTMSPTDNTSTTITPSSSFANNSEFNSTVTSKSGPPPSHAPPPLPTKQAVSNGSPSMYKNDIPLETENRSSPSRINWNSSPKVPQIAARSLDPFDIQWSRVTTDNM